MKNYFLGFLFAVALSFDGWGCTPPSAMPVDGEPDFSFQSPVVRTAMDLIPDDGILYLSASDPEVRDILYNVADFYLDRLGVQIAITPDHGRPVVIGELGEESAGLATNFRQCTGSQCSNPKYGVGISLDQQYWEEHTYTMRWHVVAHEVGHIISGWGVCYTGTDVDDTGTHLGSQLHIMSPNANLLAEWDELDDDLVCSCGEC